MRKNLYRLIVFLSLSFCCGTLLADGKTEGGLTLLEVPGARAAALGEAFSTGSDDITAFHYNPATLKSLQSGQASFLYQKGMTDDAFGQLMVGYPLFQGNVGLMAGFYDAGKVELFDGTTEKSVNAQSDLLLGVGYGGALGKVSVGGTVKYLSSNLAEQAKATAYAADLGIIVPVSSRLHFGGALQNFGTQLKYVSKGQNLPRLARLGLAWNALTGQVPATLYFDAPYYFNQSAFIPALGIETLVGPLAFRAGYKSGNGMNEISFGTGIIWGRASLDYAFGLSDDLDSAHRVSLSLKFGSKENSQTIFSSFFPVRTDWDYLLVKEAEPDEK